MKKAILFMAAVAVSLVASAKILRVSNVEGSSAPYKTLDAALLEVAEGDTIMLDASSVSYGGSSLGIVKSIVLLGPGYDLIDNGIVDEGGVSAFVQYLKLEAPEIVVRGIEVKNNLSINASKVVVNRCKIGGTLSIGGGVFNTVISQNFLHEVHGNATAQVGCAYHQITNNIFATNSTGTNYGFRSMSNSYIAYNTFRSTRTNFYSVKDCTFEKNIVQEFHDVSYNSGNSFTDNYATSVLNPEVTDNSIDKDYYNVELPDGIRSAYGAFAGDSPYVLSGVPAGPVIQDLIVPTTVEKGSKLEVTIKVGIQQ